MVAINEHYLKLTAGYLFPEIARRVSAFAAINPGAKIIRLGIGDVTLPLAPAVVEAARKAFAEMGETATFRGYGPEQGYDFLREVIAKNDYTARGVTISPDEIFVSDGAKCDTGNIHEIFSVDCVIAVPDPVYPVYVDTNVMAGRAGDGDSNGRYNRLIYLPCTSDNGFLPEPPQQHADLVYLCSPNNPTGSAATREHLASWVQYARAHNAVILFDSAYESFITDAGLPHSIFEIDGALDCAIEFRSFSKTAGFTGTRCAFTVIPKTLMGKGPGGEVVSLHALWLRRQTTKFNGVSYPVQRAATACYSPEGREQIAVQTAYYLSNARIIRDGLATLGMEIYGGINAPYVWLKTPRGMKSWDFFDKLLLEAHVVGTPGAGFGPCGEGYFRLSAFGSRESVTEAVDRMRKRLIL